MCMGEGREEQAERDPLVVAIALALLTSGVTLRRNRSEPHEWTSLGRRAGLEVFARVEPWAAGAARSEILLKVANQNRVRVAYRFDHLVASREGVVVARLGGAHGLLAAGAEEEGEHASLSWIVDCTAADLSHVALEGMRVTRARAGRRSPLAEAT